jgi:hypothetical protein
MLAPPEEPPPELPLGMLELLPPLEPEDPDEPEEPEEPEDPPDDGLGMLGEGMLEDEDCCAQPPIKKAETEPTRVVCTAMTSSRRRVGLCDIALSPVRIRITGCSQNHLARLSVRVARGNPESATAKLNAR